MSEMYLMPFRPVYDSAGISVPGARHWFTLAGSNTPSPAYQDSALTVPHENPVVADGAGKLPAVYLDEAIEYRVRVYDRNAEVGVDTPLEEYDPYSSGLSFPAADLEYRGELDIISVKSFGAIGNGSTDDTAAIADAVAEAYTEGGEVYWPKGTYLTTFSIPNFWNVRHSGPGIISRDGNTFYISPRAAQANNLYCNPSGLATNDGLSANDPINEIDQAITNLENYAPTLDGRWAIYAAAGTYAKVAIDDQFRVQYRLNIYGPVSAQASGVAIILELSAVSGNFTVGETVTGTSGATATVAEQQATGVATTFIRATATNATAFVVGNTVTGGTSAKTGVIQAIHVIPTAIIDDKGTTGDTGLDVRGEARINLNNIKFTGFSTGTAIVNERGRLGLSNVHIDDCLNGITNINHGLVTFSNGGVYDGNGLADGRGYAEFYNSIHDCDALSLSTAPLFHNWARGLLINEGGQGHLNRIKVWNCTTAGLNIKRGAGAVNTDQMQIYRCAIGLLAENNAWYNNGIDFGTGTNANTINVQTLGDAPELVGLTVNNESRSERLVVPTTSVSTHTGTTAETLLYTTPAMPAWSLSTADTRGRTIIGFTVLASLAGTATVSLYAYDGTTEDLLENVVVPAGTTDARFTCDVGYFGHDVQKGTISFAGNNGSSCDYGTAALNLKGKFHYLRVKVQLANSGDTFQIVDLDLRSTMWG